MTVNIVMLVRNRPRLTRQALESLTMHTPPGIFTLTVIDEASDDVTQGLLHDWRARHPGVMIVTRNEESVGTGMARNQGVEVSQEAFGRGDFLYHTDNDAYFTPHWLEGLVEAYETAHAVKVRLLGGYNHPFNANTSLRRIPVYLSSLGRTHEIHTHLSMGSMSWLMRWETWTEYGPLGITRPSAVRQGDDHDFCQKIRGDGYDIGSVVPPLVWHCGLHDTFGVKDPGAEYLRVPHGVIME